MSSITVGTADFIRALHAVAPHAATDSDDATLYRVRLQVLDGDAVIAATNRYTAALATVEVQDQAAELFDVDLSPVDVKEIRTLFKVAKSADEILDQRLEIAATEKHTTVTDTSGLFHGKSLQLVSYAHAEHFPNIARVLHTVLEQRHEHADRLLTSGSLLALFKAAAAAYAMPLELEMTGAGKALVVSCGAAFLGALMPLAQNDRSSSEATDARMAWLRRFREYAPLNEQTTLSGLLRNGSGLIIPAQQAREALNVDDVEEDQ